MQEMGTCPLTHLGNVQGALTLTYTLYTLSGTLFTLYRKIQGTASRWEEALHFFFPLHPNYLQATVSYHSDKMHYHFFLNCQLKERFSSFQQN